MAVPRKYTESGARPSNAGDRYHLVYVARRLLELLHPYTGLTQVVIENVSPADAATQNDPTALLGVDVAEYYGGEDVASSKVVNLVQVKYSSLRPADPWTRSRLTAKKRGGDSVFRKLAAMFDAVAPRAASPSQARITIRLLTNQPLGLQLRQDLELLREAISGKSAGEAVNALQAIQGRAGESLQALHRLSSLSWLRFVELLAAWDLNGFEQTSLARSEAELFGALSGFSRAGSERLEVLLNDLQVRATPGQRETLRRADILAFLRLREDQLYPAPSVFQGDASLFETRSSVFVRQAIEQGDGWVIVHGRSGSGKTSSLRLALQELGGEGKAVLYDCFADGQGLRPGAERFPYTKCFAQVINELEARYHTGFLATVGLDYQGLMRQLDRALESAARVAAQEGHRLVLAFDAIDNASEQKLRAPTDAGESFVPLLWRLVLPRNCTLVASLRTENLPEVVGDNALIARHVEVEGLDEEETQRHAAQLAPSLPLGIVSFLHQRTAGNPRVQGKVFDDIASRPLEDARSIILETARNTAFEYYDQESKHRLASVEVRRVLAVLYEMRQAPRLADVSATTGLVDQKVRSIIGQLSFGLRLDPGERVAWKDQDFLDWTGERLGQERETAREELAEHCLRRFEHDEYARWNLSYHLMQAGRFDRLVAWWMEPGRLETQVRAAHPHEERVLEDLRSALLGALHIGRTREAFGLLLRAADIAEGRDAFSDALADYPEVAVAAGLAHLLPGGPSSQPEPPGMRVRDITAPARLDIAAELARWPEHREAAQEVFVRYKTAKSEERIQDPQHGGRLGPDEYAVYARYQTLFKGFSGTLSGLGERESDFWIRIFCLAVGSSWRVSGVIDPLGVLASVALGAVERAVTTLGVLAADDPDHARGVALRSLDATAVEDAVALVVRALAPDSSDPASILREELRQERFSSRREQRFTPALETSIENLAAAGFSEAARSLLAIWSPANPRYRLRDDLEPYLRWAALQEALTGAPFDPGAFNLPSESSRPGAGGSGGESAESQRAEEIRREMRRSYPPLHVRASAWAGMPAEETSKEVRRLITLWKADQIPYERSSEWSYQEKAAILLETILALPGLQIALVREVIAAAEQALCDSQGLARAAGAHVLSRDGRYLGEADRLIRKELELCRPPQIAAREAMERLFYLHGAALRVNASLGRQVITAAREVASAIDSRIYARAEALAAITEAAQADLEPARLDQLCALTCYWWGVDHQSARSPGERALSLLARKDPGAAVTRAWELDQKGLLDFEDGLGHVAVGILTERSLLPSNIWPILPFLTHPGILDRVARGSIEQLHEQGLSVDTALKCYFRQSRIMAAAWNPVERGQELIAWAESRGLGLHSEIQGLRGHLEGLAAELTELRPRLPPEPEDSSLQQVTLSPLFQVTAEQLQSAPRLALDRLEQAVGAELKGLPMWELRDLLTSFSEVLPLSDRSRLAALIEYWGAGAHGAEALHLLDALLEDGGIEESTLVLAVAESIRRLLTPETLASVAFRVSSERHSTLLQGRWESPTARLKVILEAVAEHLRELGSDTLFVLSGHIAGLLERADRANLARDFIAQTIAEAPALESPSSPGIEPQWAIPHALGLALGHPRQALRWRGVYAVVHALVDTENPEGFLGPLLDILDRTDLPRWLSIREWLAFAFEHVSLRRPDILRNAVPRLLPHAVSRTLPHAKVRHHLKRALLAIEEQFPGTIGGEILGSLEGINRPVAVVPREESTRFSLGWGDWEPDDPDNDRLTPGFMDTVRYWYEPLLGCFAGGGIEKQSVILEKAADWMAKLGVTRKTVEVERLQVGQRYDWGQFTNDHGSQPQVELLRLYGERHGLYLVAGELIDGTPVLETAWSDGPGNEWDDWADYNLRGADPALPARLIDAPPPLDDNYAVFSSPIEIWRKKVESNAFPRELEVPGEPGWIVVVGDRKGFESDRSFTSTVQSALVSPRTAWALARLLESGSREAFLPVFELKHDCILPEVKEALERAEHRPRAIRGEHSTGDFVLNAWTVRFYQEGALHDLDPFWPSTARHYGLPALDILRRLHWTWHPADLLWRDTTGQIVARCDLWRRSDGTGSRVSEGYRLVMRREAVSTYVQEVGLDIIFAVKLRRQGRSNYRVSGGEEFDPGTTRCFLWSGLPQDDTGSEV